MKHWRNRLTALLRLVLVLGLAAPMVGGAEPTRVAAADAQSSAPARSAGAALQPAVPLTTTRYTITDLGTFGGPTSYAWAINESGQVVGGAYLPGGSVYHAFVWQDGVMTDIGGGSATDINDNGQIVGVNPYAFLWHGGVASELPRLGGAASAYEINNLGEVVGYVNVFDPDLQEYVNHAARWQNGILHNLGVFGGEAGARATAINDFGAIAITAYVSPTVHALLAENGTVTNLGSLGYENSQPEAVNNGGQVVGWSSLPSGAQRAFLWQSGVMANLGTLGGNSSNAIDINDAGQVVGLSQTNSGAYHAFTWADDNANGLSDPGEMRDLNDLIPPGSGWDLTVAMGINEAGLIVGRGVHNGQSHAFLLTPKPWTLMFYLAGDNDLGPTYTPILNRLEAGADNPAVNVVALWDNSTLNDSAYLAVQPDTNLSQSAVYEDGVNRWPLDEVDMSDPDTLSDFITWAVGQYPAQHYALILDDHGSGLSGGLCDDNGGPGCAAKMDLAEMQQALATAQAQTGVKLDVLYMAMCLMAMLEDAYQFRDLTDYYVANENLQRAYDEPYTFYAAGILTDTTPADAATLLADAYADVADADDSRYTISAVDMLRLGEVVSATNALAAALDTHLEVISPTMATIAANVQRFDNKAPKGLTPADTYVDLYDFAALASTELGAHPDIITAAGQVMEAVNGYVIYESHGSDADTNLDESHGVSIFFPATASSFYNSSNFDFAVGANWGGGQGQADLATTNASTWGTMLVRYFEITQPGGPDDPYPPEPIAKLWSLFNLYLPLVLR